MQNTALMTTIGCTRDTNIQHLHDENTHTSHTRTSTAPHMTIQSEINHPSRPLHKHTTYFNTPMLKNPLSLTTAATQQSFLHSHYNRHIKTNMHLIHTSIVSMHLATRGNYKILHTPPPHISSCEEILPRLTHRTLAQLKTNKSPFLKSYLHKFDAKSYPSLLCPFWNTHIHNTHYFFNCTHICTTLSPLDLWTDPAGQMDREAGW